MPGQRFVARQPILDRSQKVFGYELLFRNGIEDYFNADPELAARSTLDSSLLFRLSTLCHNARAFVNCTRDILLRDLVTLLPPHQTVVEILETVEPGERVIAACKVTISAAEQGCSKLVLIGLASALLQSLSSCLKSNQDLFLMGLLSIMDAIPEIDMGELEQLPVDHEIKATLLGQTSDLRPSYQLMLALESGEWPVAGELALNLGLRDEEVADVWFQALTWAQDVTGTM